MFAIEQDTVKTAVVGDMIEKTDENGVTKIFETVAVQEKNDYKLVTLSTGGDL